MCNACAFFCCALDAFAACGCEDCPDPDCWEVDDDWDGFGHEDEGDVDDLDEVTP